MSHKNSSHHGFGGGAEQDLSMLLDKIYGDRGWDFRNYKRASLRRRIHKRLAALNVSSFQDYCRSLDADPAEYNRLFSTLTIKVSEFFREPEVFDLLARVIAERFPLDEGVKAWCCGCAYGEEAYSLAILLSECLSDKGVKATKVFATDIDPDALDTARKAMYREESLRNVTGYIRDKYFFDVNGMHKVKYTVRNRVTFGTLDIVRSPSISRVQMLFCRNLFIYFNKALQEKVFEKLDYSLVPGGLMVLGKAEVLPPAFAARFDPVGDRLSVYEKKAYL